MDLKDKLYIAIFGVAGIAALYSCGSKLNSNRDNFDTEKHFNLVLEQNDDCVSLASIDSYTDYSGDTIEFVTKDGLRVLTSTQRTDLIKEDKVQDVYNYAELLVADKDKILSYDELQGNKMELDEAFSKTYFNFAYDFDKAIIMSDTGDVVICDVETWRDFDEDDKIQIKSTNGRVLLTQYNHVKLVNTIDADGDALYNYALSLVGGDESRIHIEGAKVKTK